MRVSLIVTTYNRPDALLLVFRSIEKQITLPSEVIIADDGSAIETQDLIVKFQKKSEINIIHSWQHDVGFRASKSRNKAIARASGEYIILIDGDMILHPRFIQDHINNVESGCFVQGSRVLLTQNTSEQILDNKRTKFSFFSIGLHNRKNAIHSNMLSRLFLTKKNNLRGIRSCNMAFFKQDCININGFNNEFESWGREDSEFIVRLINSGINRKNVRFNAIQFHLWHHENTRESLVKNDSILQSVIKNNTQWCVNGISSYL